MLGNFRNKDTLQIFNENWKVNHNPKMNANNLRKSNLNCVTPSEQAKRVTNKINKVIIATNINTIFFFIHITYN